MADGKNTIVIYRDWKNIFDKLTDDEAGKLIKHLFAYVNDENPKSDRLVELVFEPIKVTLKRDLKHWESVVNKRREAGKLGGRPSDKKKQTKAKKAKGYFEKQTKAKKPDSVIDSDSVIVIDNEINNNYKEKSTRFIPPTQIEIENYCLERRNDVDPKKWFNFYQAKNWMIGRNKMKDWKAAVRTWENNDKNSQNGTNQQKQQSENFNNGKFDGITIHGQ